MATKRSAPKPHPQQSDNSTPCSPGSKQLDPSIAMHKGPSPIDGGFTAIYGKDPEKGTGTDPALANT